MSFISYLMPGLRAMVASVATVGLLAGSGQALKAQEKSKPAPADPGYTVLDKGPIHEAFAQPSQPKPEPAPIVPKQPPPNVKEQPPDQKPQGENVQWIPGYWSWDADRKDFVWVSGFWRNPPSDRHWVPGYWSQSDGGWQWVSGFWMANEQQQLQYVPQPPASVDSGPNVPAPDDNSIYIPGSWLYGDEGYVWRPGYWSTGYDDWAWTPASYRWTPAGYTYVDGYWDYPLVDRGMLFAPVAFTAPLWTNPGWYYQPSYYVDVGYRGFLASLFFRPAWYSYYYGNYFSPFYTGLGFYPWFPFAGRFFDPLFAFVAFHHRFDHGFFPGLRHDFFVQRNTFINNVTVNNVNNVNITNINNTTINNINSARVAGSGALAATHAGRPGFIQPLNQLHSSSVALTRLSSGEQTSQRIAAQSIHSAGLQRSNLERSGSRVGQSVQVPQALRSAGSAASIGQSGAAVNSRPRAAVASEAPRVTYHSPGYGQIVGGDSRSRTASYSSPQTTRHGTAGPGSNGPIAYSNPDRTGSAGYTPRYQGQWPGAPSARSSAFYQSASRSPPDFGRPAPSFGGGSFGSSSHWGAGAGTHWGGGGFNGGGHAGGGGHSSAGTHTSGHSGGGHGRH